MLGLVVGVLLGLFIIHVLLGILFGSRVNRAKSLIGTSKLPSVEMGLGILVWVIRTSRFINRSATRYAIECLAKSWGYLIDPEQVSALHGATTAVIAVIKNDSNLRRVFSHTMSLYVSSGQPDHKLFKMFDIIKLLTATEEQSIGIFEHPLETLLWHRTEHYSDESVEVIALANALIKTEA